MSRQLAIIRGLEAALASSRDPQRLILGAKGFVTDMLADGIFTEAMQREIYAHLDAVVIAINSGNQLPAWKHDPA